jgi:hypothetical protein
MARRTPEFIAHVRYRYEDTDDTFATISADCGISARTLHRMRDREGWKRRSDREPVGLTRAMRLFDRAIALQAASDSAHSRDAAACRPDERSDIRDSRPEHGASFMRAREPAHRTPQDAGPGAPQPAPSALPAMIDRIEREVEHEIAAAEHAGAQARAAPRPPPDAERAARTLSMLTKTLHALAQLRRGAAPDSGSHDDDDMPRDIDDFRRELARRIDAFVASRADARHAPGESGPAAVDAAR